MIKRGRSKQPSFTASRKSLLSLSPHRLPGPFLSPPRPPFLSSFSPSTAPPHPPQIHLCGPTSPLRSNSARKQTALHAVITNPKLPDKTATFQHKGTRTRAESADAPASSSSSSSGQMRRPVSGGQSATGRGETDSGGWTGSVSLKGSHVSLR